MNYLLLTLLLLLIQSINCTLTNIQHYYVGIDFDYNVTDYCDIINELTNGTVY